MPFRTRFLRHGALLCAMLALPFARAHAQQSDPVVDLIRRVLTDVNDLNYPRAIRGGNAILSAGSVLQPQQEVALRLALAVAHYPESEGVQRPDSALAQLVRVVRLAPDAQLPVTLAWPGIDSLFAVARARTLAVVMRPIADSITISGATASSAIPVIASRPVRFRLSTRRLGGAEVTHIATATPSTRAELALRAVDDGRVLLERGEYDVIVTAIDPERGDSTKSARRIIVEGSAPNVVPMPVLDSSMFRPEQHTPRPWRVALSGGAIAIATFVIAGDMRAKGQIGAETEVDSRAGIVGLAIAGATGWAIWSGREGLDADAAQANAALRSLHDDNVRATASENRRRLAAHRVTVKFVSEVR